MDNKKDHNSRHQCPYCSDTFLQPTLGGHIFSHPELVIYLRNLSKQKHIRLPVTIKDITLCLITKKAWKTPRILTGASAITKHMNKPEHNNESQTQALYNFIGETPDAPKLVFTTTQADTIKYGDSPEELIHKIKGLQKSVNSQYNEILQLTQKLQHVEFEHKKQIYVLQAELEIYKKFKPAEIPPNSDEIYKNERARIVDEITSMKELIRDEPEICLNTIEEIPEIKPENSPLGTNGKPKVSKTKITASMSEVKEGKHCLTCFQCKDITEHAEDLKPCAVCRELTHFHSDLHNCYHWDCVICDKKTCYKCVQKAGGNRVAPVCSKTCQAAHLKKKSSCTD